MSERSQESRRNARRTVVIVVTLVLLVLALIVPVIWFVAWRPALFWHGRFALAVTVESESGKIINEVLYATHERSGDARLLASVAPETDFELADFDSESFDIDVHTSGAKNMLGADLSYDVPRFIVVWIRFSDGDEVRKIAEIPPGRGRRSVTILVP